MTLNQTGMDLWEMLQNDCSLEDLVQQMLSIYDVEEETLRKDILLFLRKIREAGLLDE